MELNRLHLFALLLSAICVISVKSFELSESALKTTESDISKETVSEETKENSNENAIEEQNEYEKKGLKPVVEPPFIKTFISSLCGFGACNPKPKMDSTTNYPQSEITTGSMESSESKETSEPPKQEGTEKYTVYTPDETILGETTSESPPSEFTTE
ncbi:uncharacterized protein LOC106673362 [Cimex lectularius]|uniref:Uncharacterized protein n=1 Tax=Cimex lectularius TaxID=79782 RepID=A0A8I6SAD9_CIMLE|nr:uncharacterized protein LOC106673362 [Cimex lectularius]